MADNATDNTDAFSLALRTAAAAGGGRVYAPPGLYRFAGHLLVPSGVTLRGSYHVVPSHDLVVGEGNLQVDGTILFPTEGRGDADDAIRMPFMRLHGNAAVSGLVVYYGEQETVATPVPYPWTFALQGDNAAVTDVELLGSWNGINATGAPRHYIARVQGQPLNIGLYVDETYDIGRVEDVHFNPWFSANHPFVEWQLVHGRAFVFGRSDWEYVLNTFAFGYAVGYHFVNSSTGAMNGNFLGIGADLAINASVQVDASQAAGILITNGEFTAFSNDDWLPGSTAESTQVVVSDTNSGPVKFVDSSFWGPNSQTALLEGTGTVTFSSCEFVEWDEQAGDGRAAIRVFGGSVILQGNTFAQDKPQLEASVDAKKVVAVGNLITGAERISVASNSTVTQIGLNAADL